MPDTGRPVRPAVVVAVALAAAIVVVAGVVATVTRSSGDDPTTSCGRPQGELDRIDVDAVTLVTVVEPPAAIDPCAPSPTRVFAKRWDVGMAAAPREIVVTEPAGRAVVAGADAGSQALLLLADTDRSGGWPEPPGRWAVLAAVPVVDGVAQPSGIADVDALVERITGATGSADAVSAWVLTGVEPPPTMLRFGTDPPPASAPVHLTIGNQGNAGANGRPDTQGLTVTVDGTTVFDFDAVGAQHGFYGVALDLAPGAHLLEVRAAAGATGSLEIDVGTDPAVPTNVMALWFGYTNPPEGEWSLQAQNEPFMIA